MTGWRVGLAAFALAALAATGSAAQEVTRGTGAVLRGLDKMAGEARDIELRAGESAGLGPLVVRLSECRYPVADPASNAFAHIVIRDGESDGTGDAPLFSGWMIAASPALNALDHPRYDVWVLRCTTS